MKKPSDYLDELKVITGSDNKTSALLDLERTALAHIRKREKMSDETAVKIADALKIEATEVLMSAAIARSEGAVKSAWSNAAKRAGVAASLAGMLMVAGQDVKASEFNSLYIMRSQGIA